MARSRIAEAYVQLVPSMGGFFNNMTSQLTPGLRRAGTQGGTVLGTTMGSALGRGLTKAMDTTFSHIQRSAKQTAAITAGIALAGTAVAAKGGLTRALNLEDAEMKLSALKYNAESIASITQSAMDSVVGTSFGFDSAMKLSVQAMAAGINEGQDLTDYLKLITDAATISGASLEDMGYIFNKVQGNTKAFAQEMNMMADRGLPIYAWLAEEVGMSMEEMRKAMKKGEITSEHFLSAVEKNIGGAATTAASTTRGYAANTRIAFNRLSASLLEGALPITLQAFKDLIPVIDAVTERSKEGADQFWENVGARFTPAFGQWADDTVARLNAGGGLFPAFDAFRDKVKNTIDTTALLWTSFSASPPVQMFAGLTESTMGWLSNLRSIDEIWNHSILPGVAAFQEFMQPVTDIIVNSVLPGVKHLGDAFVEAFEPLKPLFGEFLTMMSGIFSEFITSSLPTLQTVASNVGVVLSDIATVLVSIWGTLFAEFFAYIITIIPFLTEIAIQLFSLFSQVVAAILPAVAAILPVVLEALQALMPAITTIVSMLVEALVDLLPHLTPLLVEIVDLLAEFGVELLEAIIPALMELLPMIIEMLPGLIDLASIVIYAMAEFIKGVLEVIEYLHLIEIIAIGISGAIAVIVYAFEAIAKFIDQGIEGFERLFGLLENAQGFEWDWDWGRGGPGPEFNMPGIEGLADGGVARARPGVGHLKIIGEGTRDELVTDYGNHNALVRETLGLVQAVNNGDVGGGGTGNIINVYPSPGMDERLLAEKIDRIARKRQRNVG